MAGYYAAWARGLGEAATVAVGSWEGRPPQAQGAEHILEFPFDAARSHRPWEQWRASRRVAACLRAERPAALICGNVRPFGPPALGLSRRHRVPLVLAYHGNDLLRTARRWRTHPVKGRRWRELASGARLHVVNSAFTAGLAAGLGLPPDRLAVVPPEVDTGRFHPAAGPEERAALRKEYGWPPDAVVTLFVGRPVERKGLDDLFAALASVPRRVRLVAVGPAPGGRWAERARAAGAAERVEFLGPVGAARLGGLYRAADLFAGPSRERMDDDDVEGFGIVFLEAAASGLPVLATRTGGIPEAVEDGVGGVLVPPADPRALAEAWTRLAGDPGLRRKLGEGGRTGRAAAHAAGSSARRLREALERALVPPGRSRPA